MVNTGNFEDDIRKSICALIMDGECKTPALEDDKDYLNIFSSYYEELLDKIGLDFLPLDFDAKENKLSLQKNITSNHSYELGKYRTQFEKRFNWFSAYGKDLPRHYEQEAKLPYRIENFQYAERGFEHLFNLYRHEEMPDEYGWIENRQMLFYSKLCNKLDEFSLPRLPIIFKENNIPEFKAAQHEVIQIRKLYLQRTTLLNKLDNTAEENEKKRINDIEDDDFLMDEEKDRLIKEIEEKEVMDDEEFDLFIGYQQRWLRENKTYSFPSEIEAYNHEILEEMRFNFADSFLNEEKIGQLENLDEIKKYAADRRQELQLILQPPHLN